MIQKTLLKRWNKSYNKIDTMQVLWVFIGGGLGSVLRFLISKISWLSNASIWATFAANLLASILLGFLFAKNLEGLLSARQRLLLMTGFCGGFSTFSTFSLDNYKLLEVSDWWSLSWNIIGSVLVCLLGLFLGIKLAN